MEGNAQPVHQEGEQLIAGYSAAPIIPKDPSAYPPVFGARPSLIAAVPAGGHGSRTRYRSSNAAMTC
jgi:hypothetical protein